MTGPDTAGDKWLDRLSGKRIAVIGGGGFIGSATVRLLASHGTEIRAVVGAPGDPVWELPDDVQTCFADMGDRAKLIEFLRGVEIVVHAAGSPSVRASFEDPGGCAAVHVSGTISVMEACRSAQVRRVVYVSSAEVYGCPDANPVEEDCAVRPLSPYGAAKAAAEMFVRTMAQQAKLTYCVLRPFSVYGPRQSPESLTATILSQSANSEGVWLHDLKPVRDYCYVDDVAEAIARAGIAEMVDCTCNVGSGQGMGVLEWAEMILRLQSLELPVRQTGGSDRPDCSNIYELVADVRRAATVLGWRPRTSLAAGLRETIAWTQQRGS
jgi:nucleoside-diphosphate-sugar epimerase